MPSVNIVEFVIIHNVHEKVQLKHNGEALIEDKYQKLLNLKMKNELRIITTERSGITNAKI